MAELSVLTLREIRGVIKELIAESDEGVLDSTTRMRITDELDERVDAMGRIWDLAVGCDPNRGPERRYGTRNRRSMTYKLRKAVGFSYP